MESPQQTDLHVYVIIFTSQLHLSTLMDQYTEATLEAPPWGGIFGVTWVGTKLDVCALTTLR